MRVESAVKMAFLRVLAAQELLDARRDLAKIAQDAADTQRRLMNTGQADETEVLDSGSGSATHAHGRKDARKHAARRMEIARRR